MATTWDLTWLPGGGDAVYSNGNRTFAHKVGDGPDVTAKTANGVSTSEKVYFEYVVATGPSFDEWYFGLTNGSNFSQGQQLGDPGNPTGTVNRSAYGSGNLGAVNGDRFDFVVDGVAGTWAWRKNGGTWNGGGADNSWSLTAVPTTGANMKPIGFTGPFIPACDIFASSNAVTVNTQASEWIGTPPTGYGELGPSSGGGAQTLTAPLLSSGATLYAPTIAIGARDLTAAFLSSGAVLYAPTVAPGAVALTGAFLASGAQTFAASMAIGGMTLTAPFLASGASLFAASIAPGAVAITAPFLAAGSQVFAATSVVQPGATQTLTAPLLGPTATLYAASIAPGSVALTAPFLGSGAVLYAASVAIGDVALTAPALGSGAQIFAASIAAGAVALTAPFLAAGSAVFAAVSIGSTGANQAVTAPLLASGSAVLAASIAAGPGIITAPFLGSNAIPFPATLVGGDAASNLAGVGGSGVFDAFVPAGVQQTPFAVSRPTS